MHRSPVVVALLLSALPLAAQVSTVGDLAAKASDPDPTAAVTEALKAGSLMRATGARIAAVRNLKPLLGAVREALAAETDADAAREELRALVLLGGDEDVALAAKTAAKYSPRMDAAVAEAVARLGAPRSIDLYLSTVRNLRSISDETNYFTLALWGHRELLTASAARILGTSDERGWRELLGAARDAKLPVAPTVLAAALTSARPAIREAALAHVIRVAGPLDPALVEASKQPAPEGASQNELLSRELLRRVAGAQATSDPKLLAYLGTPQGRSSAEGVNPDLLTADERKAALPELPPDAPKPDDKNVLPPAAFEVPSPLTPGLMDAMLASSLCSGGWFGPVTAAVDGAGRVRQLDTSRVNSSTACRSILNTAIVLSFAQPTSLASPFATRDIVVLRPNRASMCLDETAAAESGAPGHVLRPGEEVKAPVVERRVEPVFPESARKAGATSQSVTLEAVISRTGCIRRLRILKPASMPEMNTAAILAVSQWIFRPATSNGEPVPVLFNLTVNFHL